jgi:hypothetical protein
VHGRVTHVNGRQSRRVCMQIDESDVLSATCGHLNFRGEHDVLFFGR